LKNGLKNGKTEKNGKTGQRKNEEKRENTAMHNLIPLSLAGLVSVGIILIGCFYVMSPHRVVGSFGLKPPAPDPDTRAWLRLKGIRDVAAGLAILTLMLAADSRTVGLVLLVFAVIPFGDMSNIGVRGEKGHSVLRSRGDLRGHGPRKPAADPCYLRAPTQPESM
jgi:hypothetical protein